MRTLTPALGSPGSSKNPYGWWRRLEPKLARPRAWASRAADLVGAEALWERMVSVARVLPLVPGPPLVQAIVVVLVVVGRVNEYWHEAKKEAA